MTWMGTVLSFDMTRGQSRADTVRQEVEVLLSARRLHAPFVTGMASGVN